MIEAPRRCGDIIKDLQFTPEILERVDSERMQARINRMCDFAIGGRISEGGGRPQFTEVEFQCRDYLRDEVEGIMAAASGRTPEQVKEEAEQSRQFITLADTDKKVGFKYTYAAEGQSVTLEHSPAGLIVTLHGEDERDPIATGSHFDTIPAKAGREDGQDGIVAALEVFDAVLAMKKKPKRSLKLVFVTGEDSQPFFSGSSMMAEGLSENILNYQTDAGFSLREGLNAWAKKDTICPISSLNS